MLASGNESRLHFRLVKILAFISSALLILTATVSLVYWKSLQVRKFNNIIGELFDLKRPDHELFNRIIEIERSLTSNTDWELFNQLKLNITSIMMNLWSVRIFTRTPHDGEALNAKTELWKIAESSIWKYNDMFSSDMRADDNISIVAKNELEHVFNTSSTMLNWTQDQALQIQNITDLLEKSLNLESNTKDGNGTFWKHLKQDVEGLTGQLQDDKAKDFGIRMHNPDKKLETVVAIDDHHDSHGHSKPSMHGEREPALTIMDSRSNQYVLSHPAGIKSLASHSEDPALIVDILLLFVLSYLLSFFFQHFQLPGFFGCMLAGVILGPSCLDKIKNIVQVSSIGQIGAFLLLLELGREFSLTKLLKFARITVFGTVLFSLTCSLSWGIFGRYVLGSGFAESCFIGLLISFTSTAVSINCLGQTKNNNALTTYFRELHLESIITGILLMQDAIFSTIISVLPVVANMNSGSWWHSLSSILGFVLSAGFSALFTALAAYFIAPRLISFIGARTHHAQDLVILITAFSSVLLCHHLGISPEFGAFFTGLSFSFIKEWTEKTCLSDPELGQAQESPAEIHTSGLLTNLLDVFCTLFFASLGLFVDVWFIKGELMVLVCAALLAVASKFLIMYALSRMPLAMNGTQALLVSVNLAQISELSMALGSKGRRLGLISREVYFLFAGSTLLTLVLVPFLWKLALSRTKAYASTDNAEMEEHQ